MKAKLMASNFPCFSDSSELSFTGARATGSLRKANVRLSKMKIKLSTVPIPTVAFPPITQSNFYSLRKVS